MDDYFYKQEVKRFKKLAALYASTELNLFDAIDDRYKTDKAYYKLLDKYSKLKKAYKKLEKKVKDENKK